MIKKGDTLIEVTLAIGIFSMVAVSIVSVMSAGTSGAQTALEATLAREEIDAQSEALRFIQASYIMDRNSNGEKYTKIWREITKNAVDLTNSRFSSESAQASVLQYAPETCSSLYNTIFNQGAFIIDTHKLSEYASTDTVSVNSVFVKSPDKFQEASTYPRLIYKDDRNRESEDETLVSNDSEPTTLYKAEGIYVIAVRDSGTTRLTNDSNIARTQSAYYDFFIRSCWYGAGEKKPSTISTVIRLYDPEAIIESKPKQEEGEENKYDVYDGNSLLARIDDRSFTKTNDGGTYLAYVCHNYPSTWEDENFRNRKFVGPILVSKNKNAVTINTSLGNKLESSGTVNHNNETWYYSSWESWMDVDNCNNAKNKIKDSIIIDPKVYVFNNKSGQEAVKAAASQLLSDKGAK